MFEDYYKLLGIHPGSNDPMIIEAYNLKRQKLELNENLSSEEIDLLDKAYKTLMDVPSRVIYDQSWLNYKSRKSSFISSEKPIIEYLMATKNQFEVNEDITISWKASNCDRVFLSVCGTVANEGQYTFKVENDTVFYLDVELIATTSGTFQKVSRLIRLNKASTYFSLNKDNEDKPNDN